MQSAETVSRSRAATRGYPRVTGAARLVGGQGARPPPSQESRCAVHASSGRRRRGTRAAPSSSPAVSGASAAPGDPAPGTPAYLARDAQNIADAYGRQTAPDGQLSPEYGLASAQYINPVFAADLLAAGGAAQPPGAHARQRPCPGWNSGNPLPQGLGRHARQMTPVSFTEPLRRAAAGRRLRAAAGRAGPLHRQAADAARSPGVVITTGSVQGSERMYWWLAQDLAERGYVVLTYDVQGQGRSETLPAPRATSRTSRTATSPPRRSPASRPPAPGVPSQQTSNFVYGTEDAHRLLPLDALAAVRQPGAGSAAVNGFNPLWDQFDRSPDPATRHPRPDDAARARRPLARRAGRLLRAGRRRPGRGRRRARQAVDVDRDRQLAGVHRAGRAEAGRARRSACSRSTASPSRPYFANPGLFDSQGVASPTQAPDPKREEKTGYDGWKRGRRRLDGDRAARLDAPGVHRHRLRAARVAVRPGRRQPLHAGLARQVPAARPGRRRRAAGDVVRLPGADQHAAPGSR